jgi:hypothetical protein
MMSGQLILSGKPFNTFSMARLKNIAIASDLRSPFQYHQEPYYINPCYHAWHAFFLFDLTEINKKYKAKATGLHESQKIKKIQITIHGN